MSEVADSRKQRILVVDDDAECRNTLQLTLEENGFVVLTLDNAKEALNQLWDWRPDLVLTDVAMPGMDGFDLARKIRKSMGLEYLPVVIMTATDCEGTINKAYEAGATDYLVKPLNVVLLRHRLLYLLRVSRMMDTLRQSEKRLENAQRIAKLGNWQWDLANNFLSISPQVYDIFNISRTTYRGDYQSLLARVHPEDRDLVEDTFTKALNERRGFCLEYRLQLNDLQEKIVYQEAQLFDGSHGGQPVLIGTVQDITERKRTEERILHLAYYDDLTGLPNRTFLKEHLNFVLEAARRRERSLSVLSLDLDHFGRINNSLGHEIGDHLLKIVSQRLAGCLRQSDCVARMGAPSRSLTESGRRVDAIARIDGDNFVVLLSDINRAEDAASVATRIVKSLEQPLEIEGNHLVVTSSIGIAVYPENGDTIEELLSNADAALNYAKNRGRNSFQFFTGEINNIARERLALENDLRRAIDQGELELHYQPKIDIQSRQVCGMEALVRWNHPRKGMIPPFNFIPLAEETGLIVPLGEWVVTEACRQTKAWIDQGMEPMVVSVNISARQFTEGTLVQVVTNALRTTGLDPKYLDLEITEGILMDDTRMSTRILKQLREMGVHVSLDDFGTGYSSLSYIRNFPIDTLKIDRSFLMDITKDETSVAIVGAIITLSMALGLRIVAEGVEEAEQLKLLGEKGCHEIQGYLFSRPLPSAQFIEWLRSRDWLEHFNAA